MFASQIFCHLPPSGIPSIIHVSSESFDRNPGMYRGGSSHPHSLLLRGRGSATELLEEWDTHQCNYGNNENRGLVKKLLQPPSYSIVYLSSLTTRETGHICAGAMKPTFQKLCHLTQSMSATASCACIMSSKLVSLFFSAKYVVHRINLQWASF